MTYPALSGWLAERRAVTKRASIHLTNVQKFVANTGTRRITGIASSISVDREGDVVVPTGGTWRLPLPLLWQHSHRDPVGKVTKAEVRGGQLWIEAVIAEGVGRADEIWRMVELGILDSFSIGFRGLKWEPLETGGRRWTSWELLETSIVAVPANQDARISRARDEGPVKLIDSNAGAIRLADRNKGAVKLQSSQKPHAGVPLKVMHPGIKLKRADGAIPLTGRK